MKYEGRQFVRAPRTSAGQTARRQVIAEKTASSICLSWKILRRFYILLIDGCSCSPHFSFLEKYRAGHNNRNDDADQEVIIGFIEGTGGLVYVSYDDG